LFFFWAKIGKKGIILTKKMTKFEIYSVKNYSTSNKKFINDQKQNYDCINKLCKDLQMDKHYHFRIHKNTKYIFFGDIDGYEKGIEHFSSILKVFLEEYYNISFDEKTDFKFTENNAKSGSYHYSIPKWNLSTEKLKEVHKNLLKLKKNEFIVEKNGEKKIILDTTIYSEHWFRCPNQSKGISNNNSANHIIKKGKMEDFIIDYIPENSCNIENIIFKIPKEKVIEKETELVINKNKKTSKKIIQKEHEELKEQKYKSDKNLIKIFLNQPDIYKKIFDLCYKQERFDAYEYWISIGMALNNIIDNTEQAFELFNYFSKKGKNYDGYEKTKIKFYSFIKTNINEGYSLSTICLYAVEDNKEQFIEILHKYTYELEQDDLCMFIKILGGYKFVVQSQNNTNYKLYCFNGKYWQMDDLLFRRFIRTELYDFLKILLTEAFWHENNKEFFNLKCKINKLKNISLKRDLIDSYRDFGMNNDIKFDSKWYLLGFNNVVYDMEEEIFRKYNYDDYVSTTCGYDWREPSQEELDTMNNLLNQIMPIQEERDLYLQILCTGLEGRVLEKFIIFNGSGGNGKGLIDDLLLFGIGEYGMVGNNSILFESAKTGSNPEKANLDKKRFVVFREPSEKHRFCNSTIKELCGGGVFSARSLYESKCNKILDLTMVVECNKRPLFEEEPKESEVRRIIDVYFRSVFTNDTSRINPEKHIYNADSFYKTREFQEKHKFALIKILLDMHKIYKKNKYVFNIPISIKERTENYLELSCNIVQWFKENYVKTDEQNNFIQIKELYEQFSHSDYFFTLSKVERRTYNKSFFIKYIEDNIYFRNSYKERHQNVRNVIIGWKANESE
jgi:hypothetical protein